MKCVALAVALLFLLVVPPSFAQVGDESQNVSRLLKNVAVSPESYLDPTLDAKTREQSLRHFSVPSYTLSLLPEGKFEITPDGRATMPVRVHFATSTGNESDWQATAEFVRRDGAWYFANYNFLSVPTGLIMFTVVALFIAVCYATGVLLVMRSLQKRGQLQGVNIVSMFVPLFWRRLLRSGT